MMLIVVRASPSGMTWETAVAVRVHAPATPANLLAAAVAPSSAQLLNRAASCRGRALEAMLPTIAKS